MKNIIITLSFLLVLGSCQIAEFTSVTTIKTPCGENYVFLSYVDENSMSITKGITKCIKSKPGGRELRFVTITDGLTGYRIVGELWGIAPGPN